jgi:hypothetical protein
MSFLVVRPIAQAGNSLYFIEPIKEANHGSRFPVKVGLDVEYRVMVLPHMR